MIFYIMNLSQILCRRPITRDGKFLCVFSSSLFPNFISFLVLNLPSAENNWHVWPPQAETSFFSDGEGTLCVSMLGVDYKGRLGQRQDRVCSSSLNLLPARFLVIPNSSSNHQRQTKGTKEPASLWTCHFFVQPRFLSWLDIPRAMPILPNGMTPSPLGFCLRQMSPSRPHWTSFLSSVFNGGSLFAFSTAMTRGSRYIFLGPRRLCLSPPYLMWISRVLSEETDLWPSPWQAVQMGNDLNLSILTRNLNIELDLSKNVESYKAGAFHFIDGQFPPSFLVDSHYESFLSWVDFNKGRRYRSCSLRLRLLQSCGTFSEQVSSWTKISTANWERSTDTHRQPGTSIRWLGSTIWSIFLLYLVIYAADTEHRRRCTHQDFWPANGYFK